MAESNRHALPSDLIEQIVACVSAQSEQLQSYLADPSQRESIALAIEQNQTLTAVALMSELPGLHQAAAWLGEWLSGLLEGRLSLDMGLMELLCHWIAGLEDYFPSIQRCETELQWFTPLLRHYRRYHGLPEEEDDAAIAKLSAQWHGQEPAASEGEPADDILSAEQEYAEYHSMEADLFSDTLLQREEPPEPEVASVEPPTETTPEPELTASQEESEPETATVSEELSDFEKYAAEMLAPEESEPTEASQATDIRSDFEKYAAEMLTREEGDAEQNSGFDQAAAETSDDRNWLSGFEQYAAEMLSQEEPEESLAGDGALSDFEKFAAEMMAQEGEPEPPSEEEEDEAPPIPQRSVSTEPLQVPQYDPEEWSNIPADLIEVYTEESEDHLSKLQTGLPQLAQRRDDRDLLLEIRRSVHTLKGAAGAVGLRVISQVSHHMEDLLDLVYDGQMQLSDASMRVLYRGADLLQDLSSASRPPEEIQQALHEVYEGFSQQLAAVGTAEAAAAPSVEPTASPTSDEPSEEISTPAEPEPAAAEVPTQPIQTPEAAPSADEAIIDLPVPAVAMPAASPSERSPATQKAQPTETVRVPLGRLDELVRLVSELVINRSTVEQRLGILERLSDDLLGSVRQLRLITSKLEAQYEARLLATQQLAPSASGPVAIDGAHSQEFDSLEFDRYSEFHILMRQLAEAVSDFGAMSSEVRNLHNDVEGLLNRQGLVSRELQDSILRTRMVPIVTLATRLHRTVRVTAEQEGKKVDLQLLGEHTELDKNVVEEIAEPLMHLLRNAVSHGIESPSERETLGKPERATIELRTYYSGTRVEIQVRDDGRGLKPEKLRDVALRQQFLSPTDAENASSEDLQQLIFVPGFTTAEHVTQISGRGVGMDIVRHKILQLKGTVRVESTPGESTQFTIQLPRTLAVISALLVEAGDQTFAIPMQEVVQISRMERDQIKHLGNSSLLRVEDRLYPLHFLNTMLGKSSQVDAEATAMPVLFVQLERELAAVVVEHIIAGREIVVKPLGRHLRRVHGLIGATLMGDGSIVPILNLSEMIREPERLPALQSRAAASSPAPPEEDGPLTVMTVDDSVSVRRVVASVLKKADWEAITAKDGLDALEVLGSLPEPPDLMLLDIEMPRMDGYELLSILRTQDEYLGLPVIMVTSRAGEKHRQKALDLGASGYMPKPFDEQALFKLIRELVRGRKA